MKKILATAIACLSIASVYAESGTFEMQTSGIYNFTTNDFGDSKYTTMSIKITGSVMKSDVSFLKVAALIGADCLGVGIIDSKGTSFSGSCMSIDADGDKFRINFARSNAPGQVNPGTQELIGLTGKFVGMTGKCTYENKQIAVNGVIHAFNLQKCTVFKY